MPVWIWFVFAGILVSAVMSAYTAGKDRKQEQEWLEEQGQKYIERMQQEMQSRFAKEEEHKDESHQKNPA